MSIFAQIFILNELIESDSVPQAARELFDLMKPNEKVDPSNVIKLFSKHEASLL